jgi:SRSO17 transposase
MYQEGARQPLTGEARLEAYLDAIVGGLGHVRRAASARAYCTGLLLPGERKSIEPMAARLDPAHVQAKHQSLHHVGLAVSMNFGPLVLTNSGPPSGV